MFSCEEDKIFKNTFFYRKPWSAASNVVLCIYLHNKGTLEIKTQKYYSKIYKPKILFALLSK